MRIHGTESGNLDFIHLLERLDAFLAAINGGDHSFFNRFNSLDAITNVVLVYDGDEPCHADP